MFLNDRNTTDGADVWVSPDSGGVPLWPVTSVGQIPKPLPDNTWVRLDLAGPRYFEGDFFIIVRQKGSQYYPAHPTSSFWVEIDDGTTTRRTLKSGDDGRTWQTEVRGDALIRAVGAYGNPPCAATELCPPDVAPGVPTAIQLQWTPCATATAQDLYIGTDLNAMLTATRASPFYRGQVSGTQTAYNPPVVLSPCTTYYWRVDTVPCPTCPATIGAVQSFTTTCDKPPCLPGDLNADGIVDLSDFSIMSGNWLQESATPCLTGTVMADIDDCAPTREELIPPPAPSGYVYVGRTVVVNSSCTEHTLPDDYTKSPEDIVAVRSHTITKDGVVVCDVIVTYTFRKKQP